MVAIVPKMSGPKAMGGMAPVERMEDLKAGSPPSWPLVGDIRKSENRLTAVIMYFWRQKPK
jgi:hypothetical protein